MGTTKGKEKYWYLKDINGDYQWDVEDVPEKDIDRGEEIEKGAVEKLDNVQIKIEIQSKTNPISTLLGITICSVLIFSVLWGAYRGDWTPLANMKNMINLVISRLLR